MKSNEWYTPAKYIEAARATMGGIDLDPASCALANETVKATRYYTKEENGLMQPWQGRVWLNPPYGRAKPNPAVSLQSLFIKKLLHEYAAERVDHAILLLLGNSCFNKSFTPLWRFPICFHQGGIDFQKADGTWDSFGFGTLFVYVGSNEDAFIERFQPFGPIVKAISQPAHKPLNLELFV